MSALMDDLEFFIICLGGFLIIALGSFEEYLAKVEKVMKQLQFSRLKCNICKCKFSLPKVEYLGYIITQKGIKADPNKIESFINIECPKDKKR